MTCGRSSINVSASFAAATSTGVARTTRVVVLRPALHTRVPVAESHQATDTENLHRIVEFDRTNRGDFVAVMMIGVGLGAVEGVAAFAVGAGDEHCSHALVREQTVEAARGARLVIRMSVHGEKISCSIYSPPKRSVSSPDVTSRLQARW